jgi:hypothetical protein
MVTVNDENLNAINVFIVIVHGMVIISEYYNFGKLTEVLKRLRGLVDSLASLMYGKVPS